MTTHTRDKEIRDIHEKYLDFYKISGGLGLILIGVWIGTLFFSDGYAANVYTEALSVLATVAVIDQLNRWNATRECKLALFRQVKSRSNDFAVDAFNQIQNQKWLGELFEYYREDNNYINLDNVQWADIRLMGHDFRYVSFYEANLQRAYMGAANLYKADLEVANLQSANFFKANLQSTNLMSANLKAANLAGSNLQHAHLNHAHLYQAELLQANLEFADLQNANLEKTNLSSVNFGNANLYQANLRNAENIKYAHFNENTVLPDAEPLFDEDFEFITDDNGNQLFDKYWTPDTDMTRYTNPDHPDFWEPDWVKEQREQGQAN